MALLIRTAYGSTSDGLYKVTKTFTRVGTDEGSDLKLLEDGLPEAALLLEKRDSKTIRAYCQVGNSVKIGGNYLEKGTSVDLTLNEEINICGSVRLVVEEEAQTPPQRTSRDSATLSRRSIVGSATAKSVRSQRSTGGADVLASKAVSRYSVSGVGDPRESESVESSSNSSHTAQLAVICVCFTISAVVFLYAFAPTSKDRAKSANWAGARYVLDSAQVENPFLEDPNFKSFNDVKLGETFRFAMLNEQVDPLRALNAYRVLRENLNVKYKETLTDDESFDSGKDSYGASYKFVDNFVKARINILNARLQEK